jgi:hypothetical protein
MPRESSDLVPIGSACIELAENVVLSDMASEGAATHTGRRYMKSVCAQLLLRLMKRKTHRIVTLSPRDKSIFIQGFDTQCAGKKMARFLVTLSSGDRQHRSQRGSRLGRSI